MPARARRFLPLTVALAAVLLTGTGVHADAGIHPATCAGVPLGPAPAGAAAAGAGDACTGAIRPGAPLFSLIGACTIGWIGVDDNGRYHASTAGHCVRDGDSVATPGVGVFGKVVARANDGAGADWAWIRIEGEFAPYVDPTLCRWGGPVATAPGSPAGPAFAYGWGIGFSTADETRARGFAALARDVVPGHWANNVVSSDIVVLAGAAAPGDSGSPVMSADGAPYGVITHGQSPGGGVVFATSFPAMLRGAEAQGLRLRLVTGDDVAVPTSDVTMANP